MSLEGDARPLVCVIGRRGKLLVAEPFFDYGSPLTLGRRGALDAAEGDLVAVAPAGRRARLLERLGRPDELAAVLRGVAIDSGAAVPWPAAVLEELDALPAGAPGPEPGRVDLRELFTFTIDPPTARDFDDAISVATEGDGIRVHIHIADVSRFVPAGGPLDQEAADRGCSVYLPTEVEPMLPERLSAGLCSLQEGQPRHAVTVEIGPGGDVQVYRSLIRSDHRLTYPQVERMLAGEEAASGPLGSALRAAAAEARRLRAARIARGAASVESREVEFRLRDGEVTGAEMAAESEAHALVEEFMLLANEQVAAILAGSRSPALFRVHQPPDPSAVERLAERLAALEVPTPPAPDLRSPLAAARYAAELSSAVRAYTERSGRGREAFPALCLRALQRARYDVENLGHSGLAAPAYCHFTSPIRRYPDLACHRALLAHLGIGDDAVADRGVLAGEAEHSSEMERDADRIERRGDDVALAFLLERQLFEEGWDSVYEGEVVGLIGGGLFIRFGGVFEGLLPSRALGGERFEVDELEVSLVGTSSGRRHRLGDSMPVRVRRIDRPRGRVQLDRTGAGGA
ncbi:MAG: RNB domain-containing ribonuclease [Gaiellales bacterium]